MPTPVSSQAPYQPTSEGLQAIIAQLAAISKVPLVTTSRPPKRASSLATSGETAAMISIASVRPR
jgi:hypothetical protein